MQKVLIYFFKSHCVVGTLLVTSMTTAFAAAGDPLPRCSANLPQFYLMQYEDTGTLRRPAVPTTILSKATIPATGDVSLDVVWDSATAPTPSQWDSSLNAGASVAGGMGKDGYIYAMRAVGSYEPAWTKPGIWGPPDNIWRSHTRSYEILRYGRDGVDNLGIVDGLGPYIDDTGTALTGAIDLRLGPNFNAADIDPITGMMYVGALRTGGSLNKLFKIDVTQTPPQYVGALDLSAKIPGAQSGDFAIDAAGEWAYGIATTGNILNGKSVSYRIKLSNGDVEILAQGLGSFPFGAAARLTNDANKMAFYTGLGTQVMNLPDGTLEQPQATAFSASTDAAACLPKLLATLQCDNTALYDSPGNVAQCTVTLNQPAPTDNFAIDLIAPAASNRYSSSCSGSLAIGKGQTTAQCTITATPNTIAGDGNVTAVLALAAAHSDADYELDSPSQVNVLIQDDDQLATIVPTPVPSLGQWALLLMSLALAGLAAVRWHRP